MKILYVITKSDRGGAQTNVRDLALAAQAAGHQVSLVTGQDGWLGSQLAPRGVTVRQFRSLRRSWNPADFIGFLSELRLELVARPVDVIHCHSSNTLPAVLAVASLPARQRPWTVFTAHGLSVLHPNWQRSALASFAYRQALKRFLPMFDRTIFVSNHDRGYALGAGLVPERKAAVIYNGVNPERLPLADRPTARQAVLTSAGLDGQANFGRFMVGSIGRLEYAKQLDLLIQAAESLKARDFLYVIGGDGPDRAMLESEAAARRLTESVRFIGPVDDPGTLLAGFDCFAQPSRYEGFPYALLEAGLAGLPVVAAAVGGVPELIESEHTGRLVQPEDDPKLLAEEIAWLADHRQDAAAIGATLRRKVLTEFAESEMSKRTLALY